MRRLASALVIAPPILVAVYLGGPIYFIGAALISYLALREVYALAGQAGHRPTSIAGFILAILILLVFGGDQLVGLPLSAKWHVHLTRLIITACIVLPLSLAVFQNSRERSLLGCVATLSGCLYISWLLGHFIPLRLIGPGEAGRGWVFYVLAATWAYDTGAYLIGSFLGKHRFLPRISPNKTWEGVAGGTLAVSIVTFVSSLPLTFWGWQALPLANWHAVPLTLLVVSAAQLGDLVESFIKRQAGAKDASGLIPGHGGMLDRVDSLLFSVVVVNYYVLLVLGPAR